MSEKEFTQRDIELIIDSLEKNIENTGKKNTDIFKDTPYFDSYFEFLNYFENIDIINYHSLVISSYFTYGWMPTVLKKFNMDNDTSQSIDIFNKVKKNIEINSDEYCILVRCVNNSIVGVSKLLHFINPEQYPIFDSRIKNYFKSNNLLNSIYKNNYQNKVNDISQYINYRNLCLEVISNIRFDKIYKEHISKLQLKEQPTKMRVLENLFFYFGKYK